MENVKIIGAGYAIPDQKVSNEKLSQVVDTSDEWIRSRTGIGSRYISRQENTSDLALRAAKEAIQSAGIDSRMIRLILVATLTPDNYTPTVACQVQAGLGLNDQPIMAFDINAACSGFLFALECAASLLKEGVALIIGAETLSKILDWNDRNTCVLFGDGAGACLIQRVQDGSSMTFYARSQGDVDHALYCPDRGLQPDLVNQAQQKTYLSMKGRDVFRFAIQAMPDAIQQVLAGQSLDSVDLMIPHQANIRILEHVSKKMGFGMEKMFVNLDTFGNTSAASVPIALAQAWEQGKIQEGMHVILVGFGAGFTWAACRIQHGKGEDTQ